MKSTNRPTDKQIIEEAKTTSKKELAVKYGVSQSTIYVWLERAGYHRLINAKKKGIRGELEAAHEFQKYGIDARRTAQTRGKNGGSPDIEGVPGYWVEVKRNEHLSLNKAMEQAVRDAEQAGTDCIPIVMHRRNRQEWMITMRQQDYDCDDLIKHDDNSVLITIPFDVWIEESREWGAK